MVQPILQRLPNLSALDGQFTAVGGQFGSISVKVKGFSPADLQGVLQAGQSLQPPNSSALIGSTLDGLAKMAGKIPSDPQALTGDLLQGLEQLKQDATGIGDLLDPITAMINVVEPMLQQFDLMQSALTRVNTLVSGIAGKENGLSLTAIPDQFAYLTRLIELFPDALEVSPFKEIKAYIDTLKAWMTLNTADLSALFTTQIQTLAGALPTQLDTVMQQGLQALAPVEAALPALDRNIWCTPYTAALQAVATIDLNDLSKIDNYLTLLDNQISQVNNVTAPLAQKAQTAIDALDGFNATHISQSLIDAYNEILASISPEQPGIFAELLHQARTVAGSLEMKINQMQKEIAKAGDEVDQQLKKVDLSSVTKTLQETTDRIVKTVGTVDQASVQVATALSSLIKDLQSLIANVHLPDLVNQVQSALNQLSTTVTTMLSKVTAITQQLNTFVTEVGNDVGNLNLDALKQAVSTILSQITAVLDDPEVKKIQQEAKEGIDKIAGNLESVSLSPVFDKVVADIEDLKTKVAQIDVSNLNDVVKVALSAALEVLKSIDFASQVAGALKKEFQPVLDQSTGLVQPLKQKYEEIAGQIDKFDPGKLAGDKLSPPFQALVADLNTIQPSQILQPLKDLYDSLLAKLQPLNPANLLSPLVELHSKLLSELQALSPHDLIAPLNALLKEVTGLLDKLGIQEFVTKITDSLTKITSLVTGFSLAKQIQGINFFDTLGSIEFKFDAVLNKIEAQIGAFLDGIIAAMKDVDMSVLKPALDALRAAIATIENHLKNPEIVTRVNAISVTLDIPHMRECITDLTKQWLAQKSRFAAISPPAEFADRYTELKEKLQALSPLVLLAGPAALFDRIDASVQAKTLDLTRTKEELVNLLAETHDKLEALVPNGDTAQSFKQLLRDALDEQIGRPFATLIQYVRQRITGIAGLFNAFIAIAQKFKEPFAVVTVIPDSIKRIGDALVDAKNKITGINLSFLEDELQGVVDQIIAQLKSLDPTSLIAGLNTIYQNTLDALKQLYPEAALQNLDTVYKNTVLQKIAALDPATVIGQPLDAEYQKILDLKGSLDVEHLFDPLNEKLQSLGKELDEGIDKTAAAFNDLLASLPSVSAVDVSVSLSF